MKDNKNKIIYFTEIQRYMDIYIYGYILLYSKLTV